MNIDRWNECIADIEIAREHLKEYFLLPDTVIAEFYCIPAWNRQTYYAAYHIQNNEFMLSYAKPQIISPRYDEPIYMYSFADSVRANTSPAIEGKIIVGEKKLSGAHAEFFEKILHDIPDRFIFEDNGIYIDGVTQGIRFFNEGTVKKEVFYQNAYKIPEITLKLQDALDNFYEVIHKIIE